MACCSERRCVVEVHFCPKADADADDGSHQVWNLARLGRETAGLTVDAGAGDDWMDEREGGGRLLPVRRTLIIGRLDSTGLGSRGDGLLHVKDGTGALPALLAPQLSLPELTDKILLIRNYSYIPRPHGESLPPQSFEQKRARPTVDTRNQSTLPCYQPQIFGRPAAMHSLCSCFGAAAPL